MIRFKLPANLEILETKMPETRRPRRGLILIPFGIAALTAAAGAAAYWYFNRNNSVQETQIRRTGPTRRRSVVLILTQVCSRG